MDPMSTASLASIIPDKGDQILARLALRQDWLRPEQVRYCLAIQHKARIKGRDLTLGQILRQTGLLTEGQLKRLQIVTQRALNQMVSSQSLNAVQSVPTAPQKPGATIHFGSKKLDKLQSDLSPKQFKQFLLDSFLDCALNTPGLTEDAPTPDPFGPYRDLALLGQGGMAFVYKVYDGELGHDVALKIMKPDIACEKEYVLRFLREASNTALIKHTNVVRMHGMGAVDGRLYFTMELIHGKTLKDRMTEGRISQRVSLEILRQVMEGLIAAHEQGIGHRDLKPSNIMLTTAEAEFGFGLKGESDTVVKVTDLGLARMYGQEAVANITQEGQFLGTAKYVAPELIDGQEATLQSDIFSLGIMAFQMFSGAPPFRVKRKVDYIEANLKWEAPILHEMAPEISPGVSMLVDAMLSKDPMDRPTADSLLRDIKRLEDMGAADMPEDVDDPSSVFDPSQIKMREDKRKKRLAGSGAFDLPFDLSEFADMDPKVLGGLGAAVLVVLIFFGWLFFGGSAEPDGPMVIDDPDKPQQGQNDPKKDPKKTGPQDSKDDVLSSLAGFPDVAKPPLSSFGNDAGRLGLFRKEVVDGDRAYAEKRLQQALEAWSRAQNILPLPAIKARIQRVRGDQVLIEVKQAVESGRWQVVLEQCQQAIDDGLELADFKIFKNKAETQIRVRGEFKQVMKSLEAAELEQDLEGAMRHLSRLEDLNLEYNISKTLPELRKRLVSKVEAAENAKKAKEFFEKTRFFIQDQSWELAAQALERAGAYAAGSEEYKTLDLHIKFGRRSKKGYVFIPPGVIKIFGREKRIGGMYVTKNPITNAQYRSFMKDNKYRKRPGSWTNGVYPTDRAERPVLRVSKEGAEAYAKVYKGHLPSKLERERIDKYMRLRDNPYNRSNAADEFEEGFRIVIPIPELK